MATEEANAVFDMAFVDKAADEILTKTAGDPKAEAKKKEATDVDPESHGDAPHSSIEAVANGGQNGSTGLFKVLVAVDGTFWASFAFDWYLKNVHQPGNYVICYHIMEKPAVHGDEFCVNIEADKAVMKGCHSSAEDLRNDCRRRMEENKVNGRVVVQFSIIGEGEAIVEAALKEKVNMVVVGTRGKGAVRRTLTGSVCDYVTRHVHCPVIVCCHERSRRRSSRLSSSSSISEDKEIP